MANIPILYPGKVIVHTEVWQNGSKVNGYDASSYGSVTTWANKTSVDVGVFRPGKYRVNPYSVSSAVARFGPGFLHETFSLGTPKTTYVQNVDWDSNYTWANIVYSELSIIADPIVNVKDWALQKAYAKVGSAAAAQGENIGELRQTLEMLRSPLKSLRDFIGKREYRKLLLLAKSDLSGKQMKKALQASEKAFDVSAATWLEFRYGFRPLYNSIKDIADQLQKTKRRIDFDRIYSCRSLRTVESRASISRNLGSISGTNISDLKFECKVDIVQTANAAVQFRFNTETDWRDTWGLRLQDIPETAWQLTTCSFVWDWLISIGPWLESWRFNPKIDILGDIVGLKTEKRCVEPKLNFMLYVYPRSSAPANVDIRSTTYVRTVNNGRPTTPLFLGLERMSTLKVVDSLALLWQLAINKK